MLFRSPIEGVTSGLVAAGLRVPEDVEVVANVNYPLPGKPVMPFRLLGVNLREVLRHSIALLTRQRRGEAIPPRTVFPACWGNEAQPPPQPLTRRQRPGWRGFHTRRGDLEQHDAQ